MVFQCSCASQPLLVVASLLSILFVGCKTSETASDPNAEPVVIIYREDNQRGPAPLAPTPVVCDDKKVADLGNCCAFAVILSPGTHTFKVEGRSNWFSTNLDVKKGQVYFLFLRNEQLMQKDKVEWSLLTLQFKGSNPKYGPERRMVEELSTDEYEAPGKIMLPAVNLRGK